MIDIFKTCASCTFILNFTVMLKLFPEI